MLSTCCRPSSSASSSSPSHDWCQFVSLGDKMIYCHSAITDRWLLYTDLYANEERRERGQVSGVKWSEVWVDDDIVTAVTFNEIENRTCNRNVQRFAYVCNASESCVELAGAGGRKGVLHGSGQVICLFFEQSPPQMEGQAASLRGSLGRKGFLDLITDSLTGPPMQFTKMPWCVWVCV